MLQRFLRWLPIGLAISTVFFAMYAAVQQVYRQGANDPQIQMAEDAATMIEESGRSRMVVPAKTIDISKSLGTFVIVYDKNQQPLYSSAELNGKAPIPPAGVFAYTTAHDQHRLTWQPQTGVRVATVIQKVDQGDASFVLVGRSLREVEQRVSEMTIMMVGAWAVAMLGSLALYLLLPEPKARSTRKR